MKNKMIVGLISNANTSRLISMIGKSTNHLVRGSKEATRTIEGLMRLGFKSAEVLGISRAKGEEWLSAAYPKRNG